MIKNILGRFRRKYLRVSSNSFIYILNCLLHPYSYAWIYGWVVSTIFIYRSKRLPVVVTWDYASANCRFGDYMIGLTVARLLASAGYKIIFAEIYSTHNRFYRNLNEILDNDSLYFAFQEQRLELRQIVCKSSANISFWEGDMSEFSSSFRCDSYDILFKNRVFLRSYILPFYYNMLSPLYYLMPSLAKKRFMNSLLPFSLDSSAIATNFRYNPFNPDKDNTIDQLVAIVNASRPFLDCVNVCTDKFGFDYCSKSPALRPYIQYLSVIHSNSYLSDAKLILDSSFYCQFHGGGMAAIPEVLSSIPYLMYQPVSLLVPWSSTQAFAFSSKSQVYIESMDFKSFILDLEVQLHLQ